MGHGNRRRGTGNGHSVVDFVRVAGIAERSGVMVVEEGGRGGHTGCRNCREKWRDDGGSAMA